MVEVRHGRRGFTPLELIINSEQLISKWMRILGLRGWKVRLREEPPPSPSMVSDFSDTAYAIREAVVWVQSERGAIHELCHVLLSGLDDVFWRAGRTKSLDALWKRREERVVKRLEDAFGRVGKIRKTDHPGDR